MSLISENLLSLLVSLAVASVCWVLAAKTARDCRRMRRERAKGYCGGCGYAIDGLRGPLCPECGAALGGRTRLVPPGMYGQTVGLVILACIAVANTTILVSRPLVRVAWLTTSGETSFPPRGGWIHDIPVEACIIYGTVACLSIAAAALLLRWAVRPGAPAGESPPPGGGAADRDTTLATPGEGRRV